MMEDEKITQEELETTGVIEAESAAGPNDEDYNIADNEFGGLKKKTVNQFNQYVSIEKVAQDLVLNMARYAHHHDTNKGGRKKRNNTGEGFFMSDEQQQLGALSIGPALSTLLMELSKIKNPKLFYNILCESANDPTDIQKGKSDSLTVLDVIKSSIMQLLAECYGIYKNEIHIIFEASPFYFEPEIEDNSDPDNVKWIRTQETFRIKSKDQVFEDHTRQIGGYLDTASWVFLVAQLARDFLDRVINGIDKDLPPLLTYETAWEAPSNLPAELGIETTADVRNALNELYMASLRFACRCVVYDKSEPDKYTGWMFTRSAAFGIPTYEPNLYMSYAASTMYLGLYKEYAREIKDPERPDLNDKTILGELRLMEHFLEVAESNVVEYNEKCQDFGIENEADGTLYFKQLTGDPKSIEKLKSFITTLAEKMNKKESFELLNSRTIESVYKELVSFLDYLSDKALTDKKDFGYIDFLFTAINDGLPLTRKHTNRKKTPMYTILKEASLASARYFWEGNGDSSFRKNMALGPCYSDGSLAVEDSYARAGHSNVLFNNLFVIGLIVNSAYDDEIHKKSADEYNDMLQAFQIAVQDTQRRYNLMTRNNSAYKVNSFMLEFSEQVDDVNNKIAAKLRRVNITGCYLLPILFKTNSIIEDYLIKYPQREMVQSFKMIITNRKKKIVPVLDSEGKQVIKDGKPVTKVDFFWLWDKDGYNAISNYYYVDALIAFYRYYYAYEDPFVKNISEIAAIRQEEKKRFDEQLEEKQQKYNNKLTAETDRLEHEKDGIQTQLDQMKAWRKAICDFIASGLAESLNASFSLDSFEKWSENNSGIGSIPHVGLSNFISQGEDPNLTALITWFAKVQLTSWLANHWTLGIPNAKDWSIFKSEITDNLKKDNDQKARELMFKAFNHLMLKTFEPKKTDDKDKKDNKDS